MRGRELLASALVGCETPSLCSYTKILIRTVDTDVVVLAVAAAGRMDAELWIAFGTGKQFRYIAARDIAQAIGAQRRSALPMFHAFTSCDTVSFFGGRGKKTAWDVWANCDGVTPIFCALAATPELRTVQESLPVLERFVVLVYDRTSQEEAVNGPRKHLFTKMSRDIEGIPPIQAALVEAKTLQ